MIRRRDTPSLRSGQASHPIDREPGIAFTSKMENQFVFVGCKYGFESYCKSEVLRKCENLRFAFSRPGYQTYKVISGSANFSLLNSLTFVRTAGQNQFKLELTDGELAQSSLEALQQLIKNLPTKHLHVWNRNLGESRDERLLAPPFHAENLPFKGLKPLIDGFQLQLNQTARPEETVVNIVEVDEGNLWVATHRVEAPQQCWPGGVIRFPVPEEMISRAFLKTREAMIWSRFPFQKQDTCIELGCAPGGSAQALLGEGLQVVGIDPALVDEKIQSHPNFFQIQKRGAQVKKKYLADARWLFADSNVAPKHVLDTMEDIVTNQHTHIDGMIITIKLLQKKLTDEIDSIVERVRSFGFKYVRARQLAFNRDEICLAALKRKSILRFGKLKSTAQKTSPETD